MAQIKGGLFTKGKSSGGVSGGNVWHTWTQANFIDGEATFSIGNIIKPNDIPLSVADKILYVDESNKIIECYMIDTIGDISVTLVKIGEFGGKQLYQHNIHFKQVGSNATVYCEFQIINDKSSEYTLSPFKDLCYNNRILGKGNSSLTTAFKEIFTSYYYNDSSNKSYNIYYGGYYSTSGAILTDLSTATDSNTTIEDEVVAL